MGSLAIQNCYSLSNEEWITKVVSKGGTTESALKVFIRGNLEQTIVEVVKVSNDRALELGL
jgi:pyrroline-5-carboxylate reductase